MPEVPLVLEIHPDFGVGVQQLRETQRRIRRNPPPASDHLVQPIERNLHPAGGFGLRHPKWPQELFQKYFARVSRRPVWHSLASGGYVDVVVEELGCEIGAIRPHQGVELRMDGELAKYGRVA